METIELKAQGSIDAFLNSGWTEATEVEKPKPKTEKPAAPKKSAKNK